MTEPRPAVPQWCDIGNSDRAVEECTHSRTVTKDEPVGGIEIAMPGKRIVGVVAALMIASACATPTSTSLPPLEPISAAGSSATTTTTTSTTPVVPPVTVPVDLAGKTAGTVEQQLRALGFTAIRYLGPDGSPVTLDPSWTVVSVDSAGQALSRDSWINIRVDKPAPPPPPPAPKTTPKTTPKPVPPPKTQQPAPPKPPAAAYYANCAAAKAAGAAPVYRGQPGYGRHLDRDGDGVGCER